MVKLLATVLLTVGWISVSMAEIDVISYESLVPADSPCDTTSRERDRVSQPVERIANFVMVVSNKGHCEHHMSFKEVDAIASELIAQCEWVTDDPAFACHTVMVNEKWVARASDFEHLTPARIRWNRRTHMLKQVQSMTLNERAKLLVAGEIDHNLAFGNFDFTAALSKNEIPNFGVVALTQYGRQTQETANNPWQHSIRARVVRQFQEYPNAIFLAPVRTIGYGLNPAHRKALSLKIARQIEKTSGLSVLDPLLIQRAFGPGVRSIPIDQLFEMASEVRARIVVIPEVGHDNANNLVFRARLMRTNVPDPKLETPKNLSGRRAFNSKDNLINELTGFARNIAGVVKKMSGAKLAVRDSGNPGSSRFKSAVPSLQNIARNEQSTPDAITQYQWLGSLVPESNPHLRSELFARSLVLLSERSSLPTAAERLLMARALAEIGALPAARAIAGTSASGALLAGYQAFTLGQIDAMQLSLNKARPSVLRDLLMTDRMRLQRSIGRAGATWPMVLALTVKYPSWERVLLGSADAQRLVDANARPSQCERTVQFCPNQALSLVLDAIAAHSIATALNSQVVGDSLFEYIDDLDTVLTGHPAYEEAVLRTGARALSSGVDATAQDWLSQRLVAAQLHLRSGLEFSDSELMQPGKSYPVVMFPAHKYRQANDQDFPPVFSNGRRFQFSRFSQGAGLTDFFFFRMPSNPPDLQNPIGETVKR